MTTSNSLTVAAFMADALWAAGVRYVFGMPGGETVHLLEALRRRGIAFELVHHETSAVFMADGMARASGKPGVALTTLGPGALNAVAGLGHAWLDRSPVVLITAQKPDELLPDYTHQVVDLHGIFGPITKRTVKVTASNAAQVVPEALALTLQGRPGPVHLQLSNEEAAREIDEQSSTSNLPISQSPIPTPQSSIFNLQSSIHRPVILAGVGLEPEGPYDALRVLAEAAQAPVIVTPKAKGALPDDHPLSAGTIGLTRTDPVYEVLEEADCIIAVGFDVVELVKEWAHPAPLIWLASWPNEGPRLPAVAEYVGPLAPALLRLADNTFATAEDWGAARVRRFREKLAARPVPQPAGGLLSPQQVLSCLRAALPPAASLAVDVGSHKIFSSLEWPALAPNRFQVSNGLSCMGFALPAAMGAALARPDERTACLIGDGGLAMCLGELGVLARLGLPVTVVVLVDGAIDLIRSAQRRAGKPVYGTEFPPPDFCQIAQAHGIPAQRVTSEAACMDALQEAQREDRPFLVEARIDPRGYPTTPRER
ncbi:MAG: thiamine pyrophosphate-binding protein [Caldilineae bacterium]|nr:MAG: thiamine pyrophosphate-binding protein [Caldilineae bacterium]